MSVAEQAKAWEEYIISMRREFHSHPEVSLHEFRTAQRIEEELGSPVTLVVTGGLAKYVTPLCRHPLTYDPELLMKGLALLYQLNAPQEHGRSHGGGRHYGQQGRPRAKHPYPNRRTRREPEALVG